MAHSITTTWKKPVIEHFHWLSSEGVSGGVTGGVCNKSFSLANVGGVSNQLFFRLKKKIRSDAEYAGNFFVWRENSANGTNKRQHIELDHHRPTSETPAFRWWADGGPLLDLYWVVYFAKRTGL